jgi:mRNA guanylyltransferase
LDSSLSDTILDGELVVDVDPHGVETLRFYAFDCFVLGGENVMKRPLTKRYDYLRERVIAQMHRVLTRYPERRHAMPFDIVARPQVRSYCVRQVLCCGWYEELEYEEKWTFWT